MARDERSSDDEHPEVRALSLIDKALRALPDQAARNRVLDYARGWCAADQARPNGQAVPGDLTDDRISMAS